MTCDIKSPSYDVGAIYSYCSIQHVAARAGLPIECSSTENQFANELRGLAKIQDHRWKCVKKTHSMVFCSFPSVIFCGFIFDNSCNNGPKYQKSKMCADAEFQIDSNRNLGSFVAASVYW